ncbi:hypothetical protein Syncc9902_0102 [Synechococcus sp. CC9902]|uniref:alpha-1,2-fucosyltransferase n=1 Tax=Synechococcus sp. (strain CC9902) TaxID=316279 RepID=UPI00005D3CFF|nr:alpha-1,2-fucosyltransferase [Synechococcus sp. CC9902]ABB25077.1 hypothetical protein Syncc9902_0102 [Synechococcus sp. CC9902]
MKETQLKGLTIAGKEDGFGAQYQSCLSGFSYARNIGIKYIHTPFSKIQHGLCPNKMNAFTGLKSDEWHKEANNIELSSYNMIKEVQWSKRPSIYYTEAVIKEIRKMYYSTEKPGVKNYDVAIHIRRGDVNENMTEEKFRYVPNEFYKKILDNISKGCEKLNICIVSEGNKEDFKQFQGYNNIDYLLNEDVLKSFHTLVESNILVLSRSSFSYCTGILSRGLVLYPDFWHSKLDHWRRIK